MTATSGLENWLRPYADYLLAVARYWGLAPRVTSTRRSTAQQTRLYLDYINGRSPFPAAPPGKSYHEYGRAFDLKLANDVGYSELGQLWQRMGGRWYASDPIHFEA